MMHKIKIWLAGIAIVIGAFWSVYIKGRSDAKEKREAEDNKAYRDERKKIDDEINGIGATDRERVEQLQFIADRRGAGKD